MEISTLEVDNLKVRGMESLTKPKDLIKAGRS